ncbi:hypothetical protein DPMN_017680 [Dreissena polymorpha]|uniref:Uncharacterized protein n=1 Tax=Dreissena polymorpha TaxID=45954 RepID=A0A9D4S7P2_DREPO|nr:hypothetical protein DPMN_017680 [Dreissena polymorpha]
MLECLQTKFGRTDSGQRPILKPHLSNQTSRVFTSFFLLYKFKKTGTIFQLNSRIKETNDLTKFHEHWTKKKKNAPPIGGHVFSPIWTILELVRHINKTNVLINFHDEWAKIVTSRVFTRKTAPPTGGHLHEDWALNVTSTDFKLDRDFIGTNLLNKFHEGRTINVASRVFTNKCGRTDDGQRPVTKAHLSNQVKNCVRKLPRPPGNHVFQQTGTIFKLNSHIKETNVLTKFQENWAKNVNSRVLTCFHYIHIKKNAPPTGGHVFSPISSEKSIKPMKTAPPTSGHVFQRTGTTFELNQHIIKTNILTNFFLFFELDRDFIGTKLLTMFHEDRTINVASRVFTNKCGRTDR